MPLIFSVYHLTLPILTSVRSSMLVTPRPMRVSWRKPSAPERVFSSAHWLEIGPSVDQLPKLPASIPIFVLYVFTPPHSEMDTVGCQPCVKCTSGSEHGLLPMIWFSMHFLRMKHGTAVSVLFQSRVDSLRHSFLLHCQY